MFFYFKISFLGWSEGARFLGFLQVRQQFSIYRGQNRMLNTIRWEEPHPPSEWPQQSDRLITIGLPTLHTLFLPPPPPPPIHPQSDVWCSCFTIVINFASDWLSCLITTEGRRKDGWMEGWLGTFQLIVLYSWESECFYNPKSLKHHKHKG